MKKFFKPINKENSGSSSNPNSSEGPSIPTPTEKRPRLDPNVFDNDIIGDPGKRKPIDKYPIEMKDSLRRRYLAKGPCQPTEHTFPQTNFSGSLRRFSPNWYKRYPWLEYSVSKDRAYCFYCYLFPDDNKNKTGDGAYTETGYDNWKNATLNFPLHEGTINSPHNVAKAKLILFQNQKQNIDVFVAKQTKSAQDEYRIRLTTVVRACRYLLGEGLAFRGNDESEESIHRGHFLELCSWVCQFNDDINNVMMSNAPKNNQLTSSTIQRDLIESCAKETRKLILNELGNKNFSLLLDEARDSSIKEQMAVVVRFVKDNGEITERFLGVVHVTETSSKGLKDAVDNFFAKNGLSISQLRGQGYDGASNMRGELNGLKSLILNENSHAHYIHCFAHQIQLIVVAIAEENFDVRQFFDYVSMIVNMVGGSSKRLDSLRQHQHEEVLKNIQSGETSTGSGKNQEMSVARPGTTRWGSHYKTLTRLFHLWISIEKVLLDIKDDGESKKNKGTANGLVEKMGTFEFVFIGKLMLKILTMFEPLSLALQAKDQDIGNAIRMVHTLKGQLQDFREQGWENLLKDVSVFCTSHNINIPNMEERIPSRVVSLVNGEPKTHFHHFRFEIMIEVIDEVIKEMNRRFTEANTTLLQCIMCLLPSDSFAHFDRDALLRLAKLYSEDFSVINVGELSSELENYIFQVRSNSEFSALKDLGSLAKKLVQNNFHQYFPLVYRLIELALILPVATASVERAFSAMNIVKTDLRNRLGDELLSDCLLCYVEKKIFISVEDEAIMQCFQKLASRRNSLPPLRISNKK